MTANSRLFIIILKCENKEDVCGTNPSQGERGRGGWYWYRIIGY
jgi:hypothetical protein